MASHAKKAVPGAKRGGRREGAGRPAGVNAGLPEGVVKTLRALNSEKFRLRDDASEAQKKLASDAREIIYKVMLKPGRNAAAQLGAARMLLEEACGKVADQVKIDEHNVTVEIVQSPRPAKKEAAT